MVKLPFGDALTMSLKELYDVASALLEARGLAPETPVCFYSPTGAVAVLGAAEVTAPPGPGEQRPPTGAVAFFGPELPYGVKREGQATVEHTPHPPHPVPVKSLAELQAERRDWFERRVAAEDGLDVRAGRPEAPE